MRMNRALGKLFDRYRLRADGISTSMKDVGRLIKAAAEKARRSGFESERRELTDFVDLLRAWVRGEYADIAPGSKILVVAALLYFVAPLDLVPDVLLGLGFADDFAVLAYVYGIVHKEIDDFREWRAQHPREDVARDQPGEPEPLRSGK